MADAPSSYVLGSSGVGSWVERRSWFAPDETALIARGRAYTYSELAERVRRLANGFLEMGVGHGDRVGWVGQNDPAFLEAFFACGLIGAVLAPVNHRMGTEGVAAVLADSAPTVLLVHSSVGSLPAPDSVRHLVTVDRDEYDELVRSSSDRPIREPVTLDDLCLLAHTSGTTGSPKGIMLTHGNVTWNAVDVAVTSGMRSTDTTIALAPFFRTGGTGVNVLPVLYVGGCVVVPDRTDPDGILEASERHRVTVGFGNPDLLERLAAADRWRTADLSSIRFVITGGAPVPEPLIRAYLDRGVPLLQGYGLSEAGPACLLLHPQDALRKVGSAGRPLFNVEARIVDETGAVVGPDETGELQVRGPNVMRGYWNRPDATAETIGPDGWLRTGDAARLDPDGFFWIVDRMNDAFVVGGSVVYPGDVERALRRFDGVADVAVVGAPSGDGSVPAAVVVRVDGAAVSEDDLLEACRRALPPEQVPVSVTFVEAIPRTSVGKVRRDGVAALIEPRP